MSRNAIDNRRILWSAEEIRSSPTDRRDRASTRLSRGVWGSQFQCPVGILKWRPPPLGTYPEAVETLPAQSVIAARFTPLDSVLTAPGDFKATAWLPDSADGAITLMQFAPIEPGIGISWFHIHGELSGKLVAPAARLVSGSGIVGGVGDDPSMVWAFLPCRGVALFLSVDR